MGLLSWLTGRNDIYEDEDVINAAIEDLQTISTSDFETARSEIEQAVNSLNGCLGIDLCFNYINSSAFDEYIDAGQATVDEIVNQINIKVADIEEYNDSSFLEKAVSTVFMTGAKLGEGVLSVAEGLGDAVLMIPAGFECLTDMVGITDKDTSMWEDAIKYDWSHAAFEGYYNSDLAKKSAFTEKSGLASITEGVGTATGYLALGGFVAGAAGAQLSSINTFLPTALNASSTTLANTAVATVVGMGSHSENALQQGNSYGEALFKGTVGGAAEGALAFGLGKLGEHAHKSSEVKVAQQEYDDALEALRQNPTNANAQQGVVDALDNLDSLKNAPTYSYEGYYDPITNSGKKLGENLATSISSNGVKTTLTNGVKSVGSTVLNTAKHPITTTKNIVKTVASPVLHPVNTAKNVLSATKTVGGVALETLTKPSSAAVIGAGIVSNVVGNNIENARESAEDIKVLIGDAVDVDNSSNPVITPPADTDSDAVDNSQQVFDSDDTGSNNGGGSYPSNGGGNISTIGTVSGDSAGTPFKEQNDKKKKKKDNSDDSSKNTSDNDSDYDDVTEEPSTDNENEQLPTDDNQSSNNQSNQSTQDNQTSQDNQTNNNQTNNNQTNSDQTNNNQQNNQSSNQTPGGNNPLPGSPLTQNSGGNTNNGSGNYHTGGSYTSDEGYQPEVLDTPETLPTDPVDDTLEESTTSIDEIIKQNYTKIPSSSDPITNNTSSKSGGSTIVPVIAGLSAAAAAGIGAKAYLDRKENNDNDEDSDEIETEEWSGEDTLDLEYDNNETQEAYLDDDDDYGYQSSEPVEKYDARSNEELADLQ